MKTGLTVAPGQSMESSHRHFSPYMAVYPLALLDVNQPKDKEIVDKSIQHIEKARNPCLGRLFFYMDVYIVCTSLSGRKSE